jgi:hypothetical protein
LVDFKGYPVARSEPIELAGGDIVLWSEPGGPIMLKTCEPYGDPVELNEHQAEELAEALLKMAKDISG